MKKLLVVSHTPHCKQGSQFYGWGPTVAEINYLSRFFQVEHIAPIHRLSEVPGSFELVESAIKICPTRDRGGRSIWAKLRVTFDSFQYFFLILPRIPSADLVHVRCPSNVSLIAVGLLVLFPSKPKWIKYAGDWAPRRDYFSYRLQRFIMKHLLRRRLATTNSVDESRPGFYHFINPSFVNGEFSPGKNVERVSFERAVRLLFVGALSSNKGVDIAIETLDMIVKQYGKELDVTLTIVGDGPESDRLKKMAVHRGLEGCVNFEGWRSRVDLGHYYASSHLLLLPSRGEGWPKVVSESMSFGVVPIVTNVSSVKQILGRYKIGRVINEPEPEEFASAVGLYLKAPSQWGEESSRAISGSSDFTIEKWSMNLFLALQKEFGFTVPDLP